MKTLLTLTSVYLLAVCTSAADPQEVAFSAGLSHHETLVANKKVVYDTIFTNVGGAYNSNTGIFTCPTAGLYVFQFHALSHSSGNMWLELHHNYNYVASIWGHIDNEYSAAGNSVILRLAKDDQVFVQAADQTDLYGTPQEIYGTFSGYLISSIYEEFPAVVGLLLIVPETSIMKTLLILTSLCLLAVCTSAADPQVVAFSAGLSQQLSLAAKKTVIYDTIITNVGGGYNTGIFTCPTAGLYVFQFHALSQSSGKMWLELRHNDKYVASTWGHIDNQYSTAGNSVILKLAKEDKVFVQTADQTDLYGTPEQIYGTFSGYLISSIY
nr:complement C1q-like protein 4; partial [Biomphalaria glabrata]